MVLALALIPVIGLMAFIYFNDKKEKEPVGLLIGLFFAGLGTVIPAVILELVGKLVLNAAMPEQSVMKEVLDAMLIVGTAEEICKFLVLWLFTWRNKQFNYSYDAIVYSVFVSLGFAAIENILYVFSNGISTAVLRMFTAVPGHACFAVFMGFFYSKAKYAALTNKKRSCRGNFLLAIFIPIVLHGIYDAILMGARVSEAELGAGLALILWIGFVIALFVVSCIIIVKSSRNDFCIVTLPEKVQYVYRPKIVGNWTCKCGSVNRLNFCPKCGKQRPAGTVWYCAKCGTPSGLNFCGNCGSPKPEFNAPA